MVTVVDYGRRKRLWNLRRVMILLLGLSLVGAVWQDSDGMQWFRTALLAFYVVLWLVWSDVIGRELDRTKPLDVTDLYTDKEVRMKKS